MLDYKRKIIDMVIHINNKDYLVKIYSFIKGMLESEG